MPSRDRDHQMACPVEGLLGMVVGKWKVSILWWLQQEAKRYTELQQALPGVTQKMLTQQLRELEHDGLVQRTVYPEVPSRVEYSLTKFGLGVKEALDKFGKFAYANEEEIEKTLQKSESKKSKSLYEK